MENNTVVIAGRVCLIKNTLRALFIFEKITGKSFSLETFLDNFLFYYSIILANNPDNPPSWDEFIDAVDTHPSLQQEMAAILERQGKVEKLVSDGEDREADEGEKKN